MPLSKVYSSHLHEAVFKNLSRKWGVNSADLHQGLSARQDSEKGPAWRSSWWKRPTVVEDISRRDFGGVGSKNWRAGGAHHHQERSEWLDIIVGVWKSREKRVRDGRTRSWAAAWTCSQEGFLLGRKQYLRCAPGNITQSHSLVDRRKPQGRITLCLV